MKIWKQIQSLSDLLFVYTDSSICHDHAFRLALTDPVFTLWKDKNIIMIRVLYLNDNLVSFQQLQQKYNLSPTLFYRYLQIRRFLLSVIPHYKYMPRHQPGTKDSITFYYDILQGHQKVSSSKIREAWEQELYREVPQTYGRKFLTIYTYTK